MTRSLLAAPDVVTGELVHAHLDCPIGPLTLVADGGAITALLFDGHRHPWPAERMGPLVAADDEPVLALAARQLTEYFAGQRITFDLPLAPRGSAFQQRVWQLLRSIPYGQTRSYGELAVELGDIRLARAVGAANGRNPISIVVPCHRVIGANGKLVGFGGGIERKEFLLRIEGAAAGGTAPALF